MKLRRVPWLIAIVITILILAACSSAPAVTPLAPSPTPAPSTDTLLPAAITPSTNDLDPTDTSNPQLSVQNTFEVIAAIQAYILIAEEWVEKDASLNERQAVLYPLVEYGIRPLNEISDHFLPSDALADQWFAAHHISDGFYLGTMAWAVGEWADEEYLPDLEEDSTAFVEIIGKAVSIAEDLGVDTAQYGSDFTGAIEAASALLPEIVIEPLPEAPTPGELNPALLPVQITPFVFPFAGSEIFFTIGTIENTSAVPQQNVSVEVKYFNFLDEHIGTVRGRLLVDTASPGGAYPFIANDVVAGEEAALKDWTHYEVSAFSYPTAGESYQHFELTLSTTDNLGSKYFLYGQITNIGDQTANLQHIRISAAAYDAAGTLIGVGEGTTNMDKILTPGNSQAFDLIIEVVNGEPAAFQFFAEAARE